MRDACLEEREPEPELRRLLSRYREIGGALDYVLFAATALRPAAELHRAAALAGMEALDRRYDESYGPRELERLTWDEARLTGEPVPFEQFWGSDDVEPKPTGPGSWWIPSCDGYKTAFYLPPYPLDAGAGEKDRLFAAINAHVLGTDPRRKAEIFQWSTDWSDYFDEGKIWWGAFYWTVRRIGGSRIAVVAASASD